MSARSLAAALAALVLSTAFAALGFAQEKAASRPSPWQPTNIKRMVAKLGEMKGMAVKFQTLEGASFTLSAFNPNLLLLKNLHVARPKDFKAGEKVVIYYSVPDPKEQKMLWAIMDAPSEIVLVEMRSKPVSAAFKSFDAAPRKLTVQVGGKTQVYTMTDPVMAVRKMSKATLGTPPEKGEKAYMAGDQMLLIMTADRKQVRLIMDQMTYDRYVEGGIRKFPVPPAPQIPKK